MVLYGSPYWWERMAGKSFHLSCIKTQAITPEVLAQSRELGVDQRVALGVESGVETVTEAVRTYGPDLSLFGGGFGSLLALALVAAIGIVAVRLFR